jgi:hypothetical protein
MHLSAVGTADDQRQDVFILRASQPGPTRVCGFRIIFNIERMTGLFFVTGGGDLSVIY